MGLGRQAGLMGRVEQRSCEPASETNKAHNDNRERAAGPGHL